MDTVTQHEYENYKLVEALRQAIKVDWEENFRAGRRTRKYSMTRFQQNLRQRYPQVNTHTLLKTVQQYTKEESDTGERRGISDLKVDYLIKFIFDDHPDLRWQKVTEVLQTFAGGKYLDKLAPYQHAVTLQDVKEVLNKGQLAAAGASPDEDLYTQLIQLALRAKSDQDNLKQEVNRLRYDKSQVDRENAEIKDLLSKLRERLAVIESMMANLDDVPTHVRKEYERLSNILFDNRK